MTCVGKVIWGKSTSLLELDRKFLQEARMNLLGSGRMPAGLLPDFVGQDCIFGLTREMGILTGLGEVLEPSRGSRLIASFCKVQA